MSRIIGHGLRRLVIVGLVVLVPGAASALERSECRFDQACPTGAACRVEAFGIILTRSSPIDAVVGVTIGGQDLAGEFVKAEDGGIALVMESPEGGLFLRVGENGSDARLTAVPFGHGDVVTRTGVCEAFR